MLIRTSFENHWDLLLRECSERRENETQKMSIKKWFIKTRIVHQTKHR